MFFWVSSLTFFAKRVTYNRATQTERSDNVKFYVDVFFLFNTGMNGIILLAESILQRRRVAWKRLLMAAVTGGALACILTVIGIHRYPLLFVFLCGMAEFLIVRIAFGKTTKRAFIRNVIVFYILISLYGGILTQVTSFRNVPLTGVMVLVMSLVILLFLYYLVPKLYTAKKRSTVYYPVRLIYEGKEKKSLALLDTGNQLHDPFTGEPVLIANRSFLRQLWTREPVMRVIPFHSVGKEAGVLKVFQADCLFVECEGQWKKIPHPWVAIWGGTVSGEGEYEVILHPDMIFE